jgi:hypothetical protein
MTGRRPPVPLFMNVHQIAGVVAVEDVAQAHLLFIGMCVSPTLGWLGSRTA